MVKPIESKPLPDGPLILSVIVDTAKENNAIAFKNKSQLESLQEWINTQLTIFK